MSFRKLGSERLFLSGLFLLAGGCNAVLGIDELPRRSANAESAGASGFGFGGTSAGVGGTGVAGNMNTSGSAGDTGTGGLPTGGSSGNTNGGDAGSANGGSANGGDAGSVNGGSAGSSGSLNGGAAGLAGTAGSGASGGTSGASGMGGIGGTAGSTAGAAGSAGASGSSGASGSAGAGGKAGAGGSAGSAGAGGKAGAGGSAGTAGAGGSAGACTGFCGDGKVCGTEVCDDGHTTPCGACNADCTGPGTGSVCGDGITCPDTEACDDGFKTACGTCNATCTGAGTGKICNDGVFCPDLEADTDCGYMCTAQCALGKKCLEQRDCTTSECAGPVGTCSTCGNDFLDSGEQCDPTSVPASVPAGGVVGCFGGDSVNTCLYDFSKVTQIFCDGACSIGGTDCAQADANLLCQLRTGWINSTATAFTTGVVTASPGFGCLPLDTPHGTLVSLGPQPKYGLSTALLYDTTNLQQTYGSGGKVITSTGLTCSLPVCGNGSRDPGERCDGAVGVPAGGLVSCRPAGTNGCKFDFSKVNQLYCGGSCTWAGTTGCDQADADLLCKLKLGSATATASAFVLGAPQNAPGFTCPTYGIDLGPMPEYGVSQHVYYHPISVARAGTDQIITSATCKP